MNQSFININNVLTKVMTWGRWIEESDTSNNKNIILCITGNPGVTGFYTDFLQRLHERLQCPVWVLSQAGHEEPSKNVAMKVPPLEGNENLFNLNAQVQHKAEFFHKYIPQDAKVHVIGHSIGAYMILELLKDESIRSRIVSGYLMFPCFEYMENTPNGKFFTGYFKHIIPLVIFVVSILSYLPHCIQNALLYIYTFITNTSKEFLPSLRFVFNPEILKRIFFMAYDELENVKKYNDKIILDNIDKLKFYYGENDHWAPSSYCEKLKERIPSIDAQICVRKFKHAFVLQHSEEVANMLADWIEQRAI